MKRLLLVLFLLLAGCASRSAEPELYQVATLNSLMAGNYDGQTTIAELRKQGDLGIGTFDGLDGEMIALDGDFYQIAADGRARAMPGSATTPFASVLFFRPEPGSEREVAGLTSLAALIRDLDSHGLSPELFHAVRISGRFTFVRTRSVPRQAKPYPPLVEVVKTQPVFELAEVEGDIVGLRSPETVGGVQVPGWHFHFITRDRTAGGHLLECSLESATIRSVSVRHLSLDLPDNASAASAARPEDIRKVEKQ